jgi:hypothetical protein
MQELWLAIVLQAGLLEHGEYYFTISLAALADNAT